jgi:serine/threonine protein kinase
MNVPDTGTDTGAGTDATPTPLPARASSPEQFLEPPAAPQDTHSSQFPHADDDFGLTPKPKADQQAKSQRVDPLLGMDLGGVKIVRLLGEGGMGRVYEAQQANPSRTVAVKVIRAGITSDKTMRRFEREAEFLGKLQHPGIAQIYVVGSYSSDIGDVPFFVMEYIPNAKPITNYTSEQGLTLRDTLTLFKHVCEAVSHGHDRGIVHRDLKPGNILIDSDGMPKVIDFGVARSTDSDLTLTAMRTDTGALVGTVQYMSPEQFGDSTAEGLDGRADVYSLGVVLYELLSGELPYQVRRKKMHEAARIVCEHIPPTLRSRDKSIPRDVSLIAERCLQKDRRGRYQSAGELAGEIQCVLDGRPIRRSYRGWASRLRQAGSTRAAKIGLGTLLVLAIAGLAILMDRLGRPRPGSADKAPLQAPAPSPIREPQPVLPPGATLDPGKTQITKPLRVTDSGQLVNPDFVPRLDPPATLHDELWALVDENLAAMTAHDLPRTLATMSRETPQKDLFVKQCEKEWAKAGMHYRLDALEVVERPDWRPPYAVARVTTTIRDPSPEAPGDKLPPDELSHVMLLRTKTPTTVSEWLFKRESGGWKIVANLTQPEPVEAPGQGPEK